MLSVSTAQVLNASVFPSAALLVLEVDVSGQHLIEGRGRDQESSPKLERPKIASPDGVVHGGAWDAQEGRHLLRRVAEPCLHLARCFIHCAQMMQASSLGTKDPRGLRAYFICGSLPGPS